MFLEKILDAHGHRISSKHGEERGAEEEAETNSIFSGLVDSVEMTGDDHSLVGSVG